MVRTMTPEQAVDGMYRFYNETVAHLAQDGWEPIPSDGNVEGQIPEPCALDDGSEGVRYSAGFLGPGQADPLEAAKALATYWEGLGLKAEALVPANPKNPRMIANGVNSSINAQYMVRKEGASLSFVSGCAEGNEKALHDKVVQNRERSAGATPAPTPPTG